MSRTPMTTASVALAALLLLTACQTASPPSTGGGMSETPRPPLRTTTPGPIGPTGTATDVPPARWAAIEADLAGRGVSGGPELVTAEAVTFTDGSLGCPQPGLSYTQALVDGMRVVVTAGGARYDYRFGSGDEPRLCER